MHNLEFAFFLGGGGSCCITTTRLYTTERHFYTHRHTVAHQIGARFFCLLYPTHGRLFKQERGRRGEAEVGSLARLIIDWYI